VKVTVPPVRTLIHCGWAIVIEESNDVARMNARNEELRELMRRKSSGYGVVGSMEAQNMPSVYYVAGTYFFPRNKPFSRAPRNGFAEPIHDSP
jgi:hypothetical protein